MFWLRNKNVQLHALIWRPGLLNVHLQIVSLEDSLENVFISPNLLVLLEISEILLKGSKI